MNLRPTPTLHTDVVRARHSEQRYFFPHSPFSSGVECAAQYVEGEQLTQQELSSFFARATSFLSLGIRAAVHSMLPVGPANPASGARTNDSLDEWLRVRFPSDQGMLCANPAKLAGAVLRALFWEVSDACAPPPTEVSGTKPIMRSCL